MRLRRLLAALLILDLALPAAPALAADQDGSTPRAVRGRDVTTAQSGGSFDVMAGNSSGAATLTYPIEVAPGTNGAQPTVALSYSSASKANSWVGKGWSLGFGAVERSLKEGVPAFNATDTYTLNGEPLVLTAGTTRYETRRKSFARIRQCEGDERMKKQCAGVTPEGATAWVVEQPDGTVQRYGLTPESRIGGPNGTAKWLLAETYDPDGNVVVYRYSSEDVGQRYPSEIRYTLRRPDGPRGELTSIEREPTNDRIVRFVLEARDDPRLSYASGYEERTNQRLARIEIIVPGTSAPRVLRSYDFTYEQSFDNKASLLTQIAQLGLDGGGDPLTTKFAYTTNKRPGCDEPNSASCPNVFTKLPAGSFDPGDAVTFVTSDLLDGGVRIADVNSDGRADLVRAFIDEQDPNAGSANGAYLNNLNGFSYDSSYRLPLINVRNAFRREGVFSILGRFSGADLFTARSDGFVLADFTRDGRPDVLRAIDYGVRGCLLDRPREFFAATTGGFLPSRDPLVGVAGFAADAFTKANDTFASFAISRGTTLAELDGDGRPDIVLAENGAPAIGSSLSLLNNGDGTFRVAPRNLVVCAANQLGTDPGNDCNSLSIVTTRIDAACDAAEGGKLLIKGGEPLGKRYFDVNGDGLDDFTAFLRILLPQPQPPNNVVRFVVLNEGGRFGASIFRGFGPPAGVAFDEITQTPRRSDGYLDPGVRTFDINGDGILDLVQATPRGNVRKTWLGTQIASMPYVEHRSFQVPEAMLFSRLDGKDLGVRDMDVDADGVADLIRFDSTPGGSREVWRNDGVVPDLLAQVDLPAFFVPIDPRKWRC